MIISFLFGFFCGMMFLALACVRLAKTHDLTVINGKIKWIDRTDKIFMTYEQLKEKYKV